MKYLVTFNMVAQKVLEIDADSPAEAIKRATRFWKSNTEPEFQSIEVKEP